jgi:DNA repair protein RadC
MRVIEVVYRERPRPWGTLAEPPITSAWAVAQLMAPLLHREVVEVCVVLCLDSRLHFLGYHELSRGSLSEVTVEPRQVFQAAFLANAAAVIVVHNHPSGDPTPSPDDRNVFQRLKAAGAVMGIDVHDFVIVAGSNRYSSMREPAGVVATPALTQEGP